MVVYWDLCGVGKRCGGLSAAAVGGAARGRTVPRLRLLGAAAFGAAYAVLRLVLPCSPWLTAAAFVGWRCSPSAARAGIQAGTADAAALLRSRRRRTAARSVLRLTWRIARGVIFAQLPWGVLLGAMGVTYLLLSTVFRGGARHDGGELLRVRLTRGREDRHASTAARQRQSAHRSSPGRAFRSSGKRPARAAAGARRGLHNAFLHDGGRQRDAAGVLLRQRSRERQGLGTAAGRRLAGHLRRQRLSGRMAHGGTGGGT